MMPLIAQYVFWISLAVLIYTYAGYPVLLFVLVALKKLVRKKRGANEYPLPPVTLVVAAYNEEEVIREKIRNTLQLDYPSALLDVVFVTDGSTDNTPTIVKEYAQIRLLHESGRKGKLAAMNRAVHDIKTGLVVFSDANGFLNPDALKKMVAHYADPAVGAVTGEKRIRPLAGSAVSGGEGLYWKYESLLKKLDSDLYTVVGAAGELFSVRRELYETLDNSVIIEDFVQSLNVCKKGFRVVYEPGAYSEEEASGGVKDEMERKVRIAAGGFQAMAMLGSLLNPFRYPVVGFQYISHRVLRWTLCPLALVLAGPAAALAAWTGGGGFYGWAAVAAGLFYAAAATGWVFAARNRKHRFLYLPFYFLFMHFCVFAGFARYVKRSQGAVWTKAERRSKI